jgi:EmrB/QacA subfamily drug resistance transporter
LGIVDLQKCAQMVPKTRKEREKCYIWSQSITPMNASTDGALRANKRVLLAITLVANFFNPFTGSAVNIALPQIAAELGLNAVAMSWVTMAYLLTASVFMVPVGKLADRWGRKLMFLWGNVLFLLASFGCAFSHTAVALIVFRMVQGLGGAMMVSVSMALLMSVFAPNERGKVIGFNVASVYLGLSAAPVLGGVITQYWGWKSLFLINGGVSVAVAVAIALFIKDEWKVKSGSFDWKGVYWYVPSLLLLMYGFSKLPDHSALVCTVLGMLGMLRFLRLEMGCAHPVVDVALFRRNRVYGLSNLSAFINYAATYAVSFVLSLYLQYVKGLSPRDAGAVLMVQPVVMAVVSIVSGRLSDRWSASKMASAGMALSVVGLLMMAFLRMDTGTTYILLSLGVLGLGFGTFSSPNTNVVMSSVEHQYFGVASATLATMRNLGMMFSMAVATLSVHLFLGNRRMDVTQVAPFIHASKAIFSLFSVFCLVGVFASLSRNRVEATE